MARAIREARRRRELDARARAEEAAEPEFSHVRAAAEFREAAAARQQRQRRPSRQARQPLLPFRVLAAREVVEAAAESQ